MAKTNEKLTADQIRGLLETMYGRPLRVAEVDNILENTSSLQLAYHSTHGGLDIVDYHAPAHSNKVLTFTGRGALDTVESARLQEILFHPGNAAIIYDMFESGVLTVEQTEIKEQLYKENYSKQKNAKLNKSQGNI